LKKLVILLISLQTLFGYNSEVELFNKLFTILFQKKEIKIYTKKYTFLTPQLKIVSSCKLADLTLGELNCSKPKFLLDYYNFKNDKNAIGAFYWRKGRPQLRLRKKELEKYKLFISKNFEDYLEWKKYIIYF